MEGKEVRFGVGGLLAVRGLHHRAPRPARSTPSTTRSPASAAASLLLNMMLGEVAPGGVGAGLYGMLVMAIIAVFLAGLMVGRTPEYLGKKIGTREIKLARCTSSSPRRWCSSAPRAMALPDRRVEASARRGPARLLRDPVRLRLRREQQRLRLRRAQRRHPFYNTALGLAMLLGRFVPMVLVLALAGSLAEQQPVPADRRHPADRQAALRRSAGRRVLIVAGLTFFPALALGPLAEALS